VASSISRCRITALLRRKLTAAYCFSSMKDSEEYQSGPIHGSDVRFATANSIDHNAT
jgi:hypothetical protein